MAQSQSWADIWNLAKVGLQKQTRVDNFFAGIEIVNDISTVERATTNHSLQIEETFQADTYVKKADCILALKFNISYYILNKWTLNCLQMKTLFLPVPLKFTVPRFQLKIGKPSRMEWSDCIAKLFMLLLQIINSRVHTVHPT